MTRAGRSQSPEARLAGLWTPRRIAFTLGYLLFLFILAEGTARVLFAVPFLSNRLSIPDDYGWRRAWVARHKSTGKDVFYTFDRFDSLTGWRAQSNVHSQTAFGGHTLTTNAQGFRAGHDFAVAKAANVTRVLLLGDSFTFGDESNDDVIYPSVLQQLLPSAEIMNFGVHGYGHDQMLILLRTEGIQYHPDVVILGFFRGDVSRNLLGFRDYAKPRFRLADGRLIQSGTPVPTPDETLRWDWARPRVIDLESAIRGKLRGSSVDLAASQRITRAILGEMARVVDSIHATPVFAYLPNAEEIERVGPMSTDERWFVEMCRELSDVRCVSARPEFEKELRGGATFKTQGHWDAAGHRAVAIAIAQFLTDSGLVAR